LTLDQAERLKEILIYSIFFADSKKENMETWGFDG